MSGHPGKHLDGEPKRIVQRIPPGKHALNVHVATTEHDWLKRQASARAMTVTGFLRSLIRREMDAERLAERAALAERFGERKVNG